MSDGRRGSAPGAARRLRYSAGRTLSVIVPVHQGAEHLQRVLAALGQSALPGESWELIVVDDASTDGSAEIAAGHADLVIRLTGAPRGPAYARNRGFEVARGTLVAFVDSDVLVHPHAIVRMIEEIHRDPAVGAVIGTYDDRRTSGRLVAEYRNLLRHFEHHRSGGDTDAFSAGLALVRRDAFARAGMFDEWRFPRPQAEALELGDRLRSLGHRIVRRTDAQATHLKRWTFAQWVRSDLLDRSISVARLNQFRDLRARVDRLYSATPIDAVFAWAAAVSIAVAAWRGSLPTVLFGLACIAALVAHNAGLFAALARARGVWFAMAAIPLHVTACAVYGIASTVGRALYHAVGEKQPDAVLQAYAEVGVRTWPPVPARRSPMSSRGSEPTANGSGADRGARIST